MVKKCGFDLDGVFVGLPPLVPAALIDWLYKDHQGKELSYRFPGLLEQKIRRLSHLPFVRPPIEKNCDLLRTLFNKKQYEFYLVSGRFAFLKDLTDAWLKKYNLVHVFKKIYLNLANEQPHQFKERILKQIPLSIYIEDDFDSLRYLAKRLQKIKFYWYTKKNDRLFDGNNVTHITDLDKILE